MACDPNNLIDTLHPAAAACAREVCKRAAADGIDIRIVSGRRTCAQQNAIYAQGRTMPGKVVSGAHGCRSWHTWGLAFDFFVMEGSKPVKNGGDPRYEAVGRIGRSIGMKWGGDFGDPGHLEYHPNYRRSSEVCPDSSNCVQAVKTTLDVPMPTIPGGTTPPDGPPPHVQPQVPVGATTSPSGGAAVLLGVGGLALLVAVVASRQS